MLRYVDPEKEALAEECGFVRMTAPLHLLRPFTNWDIESMTVAAAHYYVAKLGAKGPDRRFGTWTARPPRRVDELAGGSVYFVQSRRTLFRMPFTCLQETPRRGCWILMEMKVIPVERAAVGMVRGWRYLEDADAPRDLVDAVADDYGLPDDLRKELKQLGL